MNCSVSSLFLTFSFVCIPNKNKNWSNFPSKKKKVHSKANEFLKDFVCLQYSYNSHSYSFVCFVMKTDAFVCRAYHKMIHSQHNSYSTTKSVSLTRLQGTRELLISDWPKNTLHLPRRAGLIITDEVDTTPLRLKDEEVVWYQTSFNQRCEPQHQIRIWWVSPTYQTLTRSFDRRRHWGQSWEKHPAYRDPGNVPSANESLFVFIWSFLAWLRYCSRTP